MKSMFLFAIAFVSASFGAWQPDRFIIGSYWDPPFFDDETADLKSLQQFKDAGFNTLGGLYKRSGLNPGDPITTLDWTIQRYKHALQLGGIQIFSAEKMSDGISASWEKASLQEWVDKYSLNSTTNSFKWNCPNCRSIFSGYHVWDEPTDVSFIEGAASDVGTPLKGTGKLALSNMQRISSLDPDKLAWVNLLPFHASIAQDKSGNRYRNFYDYGKYLGGFLRGGAKAVSFDFYPLYTNAQTQTVRMVDGYYLNHQIFADSCRKYEVPFMGVPLSQAGAGLVIPSQGAAALTAFVPVVYGAKGVFWYTYASQTDAAMESTAPAIVNTDGTPNLTSGAPIYTWVKSVNTYLNRLGPTILKWTWLQTVHGSSTNNQVSYQDGVYELNLPTIDFSTLVLKGGLGAQGSYFAVGIFSGKAQGESFLAILNKDLTSPRTITFSLKKPSRAYLTTASMDSWKALGKNSTFTLQNLQPGEMQVVRLTTQSVSGNIIPLQ